MIRGHDLSELLLHEDLAEHAAVRADDIFNFGALHGHLQVESDPSLVSLDRAHGGIRWAGRLHQRCVVILHVRALAFVARVRLHQLQCTGGAQPELFADIRVQVVVLSLAALVEVDETVENHVALGLRQDLLSVQRAVRSATFAKLEYRFFTARLYALWVHRHRL